MDIELLSSFIQDLGEFSNLEAISEQAECEDDGDEEFELGFIHEHELKLMYFPEQVSVPHTTLLQGLYFWCFNFNHA